MKLSILPFSFIVIIILSVLSLVLIDVFGAIPYNEPTFTWGWNADEGYFKIYWSEFTYSELSAHCFPDEIACAKTWYSDYAKPVHVIFYSVAPAYAGYDDPYSWKYNEAHSGCNTWTHENLHHWGYNEAMISDFFQCNVKSKYLTLPIIGFN